MSLARDAIRWWEIRRLLFNFLLLIAGVATIGTVLFVGSRLVPPGEDFEEPLGLLFFTCAYAVGANVFYTLGWFTEVYWSQGDPTDRTAALRPTIFWVGTGLSILLTLCPAFFVLLLWLLHGCP